MQMIKSIKRSKGIIITKSVIVVNILKEREEEISIGYRRLMKYILFLVHILLVNRVIPKHYVFIIYLFNYSIFHNKTYRGKAWVLGS